MDNKRMEVVMMEKKAKVKPLRKAWLVCPKNVPAFSKVIYAETAGKAKYDYFLKLDGCLGGEVDWRMFSASRCQIDDLFPACLIPEVKKLTKRQLYIITRAKGTVGHRKHFHGESNDPDLLSLVEMGLMSGPHSSQAFSVLAYFYLTDLGKRAARSLLPRRGVA